MRTVTDEPTRIVLEVQVINESPIGVVRAADGTAHRFAGWLGMLAELGTLLPGSSDDQDEHDLGAQ